MSTEVTKETRDEPAVSSPPSNRSTVAIPPSLLQNNPHGHHHHAHQQPHSPKSPMTRKQQGFGPGGFGVQRPRSHSLGTAYSPLLMPQTPPPSLRGNGGAGVGPGGQRALSLSPNVNRAGNVLHQPILNRMEPPKHSDIQKVMEDAMQKERIRNKRMQEDEKDMTADELRAVLKKERYRMSRLVGDLAKHKQLAVQNQADAEMCEEGRINCLMRRLDDLQIEKGRIIVQLEQEEEMLTNTLQKKLNKVRNEKAQLEKLIEHEHLQHSNLQSTLTGIQSSKQLDGDAGSETNTTVASSAASSSALGVNNKKRTATSLPPRMGSLAESVEEEEEEGEQESDVTPMET